VQELNKYIFVVDTSDRRGDFLLIGLRGKGFEAVEYGADTEYSNDRVYVFLFAPRFVPSLPVMSSIPDNSVIFVTGCQTKVRRNMEERGIVVYKYFDDAVLAADNAALTAEGAVAAIINNTDMGIFDMPILILGGGRVAKAMAMTLGSLGAKAHMVTRRKDELSFAELLTGHAYHLSRLDEVLSGFAVVVNTIPSRILYKERLEKLDYDSFVLDLASKPYGIDSNVADSLGIRYLIYSGVPGKTAPKAAADAIQKSILARLNFS